MTHTQTYTVEEPTSGTKLQGHPVGKLVGSQLNLRKQTHTLEKVAPWSVISGSFAVCISPLNLDTAGNNV